MDISSISNTNSTSASNSANASAGDSAKHPLIQPMLVIGGLSFGIIAGLVLSLAVPSATSTPEKQALPVYYHTAAVAPVQPASNTPASATKLTRKYAKNSAAEAVVTPIDPASHYLTASKTLTPDSIEFLGSLNNTTLTRPDWSWSREDLTFAHASNELVLSTSKSSLEIQPKSQQRPEIPAINKRLVVVLDPGHGGIDPGSEAHNGLLEKELTLDMAKRVELFLSEVENVDVIMTRDTDKGMSRQNRVNKIKAVGADVVVSLHFNHLPQTDINLVETFYADRHNVIESLEKQNIAPSTVNLDYTSASKTLAHIMHKKVYNEVATSNNAVIDAGVKRDTLFVLTRSFTPGVLLELTCISNPAEAERLALPSYRNQLAASIADGLRDYLLDIHREKFDELLVKLDL